VKFLRDLYFKKLVAIILLALFVFTYAVKAFHTHEFSFASANNISNKNATNVKADFYCIICDFQIAKDSDTEIAALNISTPVLFITTYYNYALQSLKSLSVVSSVRGPPLSC